MMAKDGFNKSILLNGLRALVYFCLFLPAAVVLIVNFIFSFRFGRLDPKTPFWVESSQKKLSTQNLKTLGWYPPQRSSHFGQFSFTKSPGVVRVGCFGDSFTYGDETSNGGDYPSHLQRIFRERGYSHVEVINFGASGFSFSQTFALWEDVGKKFDLDFILLGPADFFELRDSTFKSLVDWGYSPYHVRYILHGQGTKRMELTDEEKAQDLGLFQPWKVMRYDRRTPHFFKALLPRGREFPNPFYYRKDLTQTEEMNEIYARLIKQMSREVKQVIVMQAQGPLTQKFTRNQEGIFFIHDLLADNANSGLHLMVQHYSSLGNEQIAEIYFQVLTKAKSYERSLINYIPEKQPGKSQKSDFGWEDWKKISFYLEDQEIADLAMIDQSIFNAAGLKTFKTTQENIQSLLWLYDKDDLQGHILFLGLEEPIDTKQKFILKTRTAQLVISRPVVWDLNSRLGHLPLSSLREEVKLKITAHAGVTPIEVSPETMKYLEMKEGEEAILKLGNKELFKGHKVGSGLFFHPLGQTLWRILPKQDFPWRQKDLEGKILYIGQGQETNKQLWPLTHLTSQKDVVELQQDQRAWITKDFFSEKK